nr:uncharacterized protein LOC113711457 [Coffea arabica]
MAEGTRMKSMEEQLRKQELLIQGILDSMATDKRSLEDKIDAVSSELSGKLDAFMAALTVQLTNRDKGLLRTPEVGGNRSTDNGAQGQQERGYQAGFSTGNIKLELPVFKGEQPREWIRKTQKYFQLHRIPKEQWLGLAEFYLEDKADVWYQSFKAGKDNIEWESFSEELHRRFGRLGQMDPVEEFNKLQLSTTVLAYQEKFEDLRSEVMIRVPHLSESYFVSSFLSGLPEELRSLVRTHKPETLTQGFELARLQENALESILKRQRSIHKTSSIATSYPTTTSSPSKSVIETASKRPNVQSFKKISPAEIQYRRDYHLCFKCGEKYGSGHQCKQKEMHLLLAMEEEDVVAASPGDEEIIEYHGHQGKRDVEFAIHALTGKMLHNTIKLKGQYQGTEMSISVDGGSTHSFVTNAVAQICPASVQQIKPFRVWVANGQYLWCRKMIPKMTWEMQGRTFSHNMFVLNLEPYDMIVGVDWMAAHSPITFDFKNLSMVFDKDGDQVLLQGDTNEATLNLRVDPIEGEEWSTKLWKRSCGIRLSEAQVNDSFHHSLDALLKDYKDVFGEPNNLTPQEPVTIKYP